MIPPVIPINNATNMIFSLDIGSSFNISWFYQGNISNLNIYSQALLDSEIESLYKQETIFVGLEHNYKLNEGTGSVVLDSIGSSNGTITGSTWTKEYPENIFGYNKSKWQYLYDGPHKFIPPTSITSVSGAVIAGGGGGGYGISINRGAGGGGAGGFRTFTKTVVPGNEYSIIVGKGGNGGISSTSTPSTNGENSSFDDIISTGGGYGANPSQYNTQHAGNGGSGGGGHNTYSGGGSDGASLGGSSSPVTSPVQGYAGANGQLNSGGSGSGGGGATSAGSSASGYTTGQGGSGVVFEGKMYCVGGGGGYASGTTTTRVLFPAVSNTGNGGNGGGTTNIGRNGQNGASGEVVVIYGNTKIYYKGEWEKTATYHKGDIVQYNGKTYQALETTKDKPDYFNSNYLSIKGITKDTAKVKGKFGDGFKLSGHNESIDTNTSDFSFGVSDFSVSCWVKFPYEANSNRATLISTVNHLNLNGWGLFVIPETGIVQFGNGPAWAISSVSTINDNQWHHIVGNRKNINTFELFIDGELDVSNTINSGNLNTNILQIGNSTNYNGTLSLPYSGIIDEINIFNTFLEIEDIKRLYLNFHPLRS